MVKGIRAYDNKNKRRIRRANHVAKDLRTPKYRIRRVENDKEEKYKNKYYDDDQDYE